MSSALEDLRIASPCSASWDAMIGDARVRHCGQCKLNVYNLSGMTRDDATALLEAHEGKVCVRLLQRADGTVVTRDCADQLARARRGGLASFAVALALGGSLLAAACGVGAGEETEVEAAAAAAHEDVMMGKMGEPEPRVMMGAPMPVEPEVGTSTIGE